MNENNMQSVFGLTILMASAIFVVFAPLALALPTADNFGVNDASGCQNSYKLVPVSITNAQNGPIAGISFDILYNNNVISVVGIQAGSLTPDWDFATAYVNYTWGTVVSIVYGGSGTEIENGSTGSVVMLNFSIIGNPGETTDMNLSNIQLSDVDGNVGFDTASPKNGTFTVRSTGTISGRVIHNCNATGIAGAIVNLTNLTGSLIDSTTSDSNGNYTFTSVSFGIYNVNVSKTRFWDNSTSGVTLTGATATVPNVSLWLKGDLNNEGHSADIGDLVLMKRARLGEIAGDWKYDLNNNTVIADIGDLVLMKRARLGEIELL